MHLLRNIAGLVLKYACVFISIYTHIKLLGSFSFIAPFERQNRIDCYICVCVHIYICLNTKSLGSFFFHVHFEKRHRNNCSMPANEPCYSSNPRRGGGLGSRSIFKNLMSPTPRRKWYLTTGRRAH